MISKIYSSSYVLHKAGTKKGKSKSQIEKEERDIIKSLKIDKLKQKKIKDKIHQALSKDNLTDWEKNFLVSLKSFKKLSVKQLETLHNIILK